MSRRETVIALLESLEDVTLSESGGGSGSRGDRLLLLSGLYHKGSYADLERCLKLLEQRSPSVFAHVRERYLHRRIRTIDCPYKRTTKGLVPKIPPHTNLEGLPAALDGKLARVRVAQWSPWVRMRKVDLGVTYLTETMNDPVQLPVELLPEAREAA